MSVDTSFADFEADLEHQAPPEPVAVEPEAPPVPEFSIDDLAPIEESDLQPDPEKEELRRKLAAFEQRPAPSPFDPPKPEDPRAALRAEFIKKLQSGDENAVADAFVMAAEMGARGAEERLRSRFESSQGSMISNAVDRFVTSQQAANPQLWKAVQKDFNSLMDDARKRVDANPEAKARLTEAMVKEACEEFFERSKGRALDRYMEKATKAKQPAPRPAPTPTEPVPDYNILSGADNGKSGPLVPKDAREARIIKDGRIAGLSDDDIRDLL